MASMNIEEIIKTREKLDHELQIALSTMERKDTIAKLKLAIKENQQQCPHKSDKFNWEWEDERCPYCGKKMVGSEN